MFEPPKKPHKHFPGLTHFPNPRITITFNISDLVNYQPDSLYEGDEALGDGELSSGDRSHRDVSSAGGSGRSSADASSGEEAFDEDSGAEDGADDSAVPCQLQIVIEKPGSPRAGALAIEAVAEDGAVSVQNVVHFADARLARADADAETRHDAAGAYAGPPFGSLDEDLQILVERFLEERGVTPALAVFVPDYMEFKEQREYMAWLANVKGFLEA